MPAPSSSSEFLDLIRKSGVVEEKRLEPHVSKLHAEGHFPREPNKLAGVLVRDGLLTHFQAEQLLQGKWRRFSIGKYKVLERLGSGGMGAVYLCEHKVMRRRVAVKVLPAAKAAEPSSLERFYREARAVAALDHPNIVHAYDIDQDDTLHFLVMEYVNGASLQEIVKKSGPLDPVRAAHYVSQTTQGLAHAHLAGLIHRDIKPGNLLVDRTGELKILDMGLARFFNDEEDMLTRKFDENVLGTADYLAPEQAVDSHDVDTRADIYSLGATFYFMLTGRTPFEEGTVAQKLIWHQTRQPKSITTFRRDVPAEMVAVLERMMAKIPDERFQHPLEVFEALQPWVTGPIAPPSEQEMPRLSPAATTPTMGDNSQAGLTQKTGGSSARNWQVSAPQTPPSSHATKPSSKPPAPTPPCAATPAATPAPRPKPPASPNKAPLLPNLPGQRSSGGPSTPAPAFPSAGGSPWESLTENDAPIGSSRAKPIKPPSGQSEMQEAPGPPIWLFVVLAMGAILAGIVTVFLWRMLFPARAVQNTQPVLKVSRDPAIATNYRSIRSALQQAENGDVIELWDDRYQENVVIDPGKGWTRVTVRPAEGKTVIWTYPNLQEKVTLLKLNKAEFFHLDGKGRLTLDGQGKTPTLVAASLHSPGLTVSGVHLKGFTDYAVRFLNCEGTAASPVALRNLNFSTEAANARAFYFDAKLGLPVNDYIHVRQCLFQGALSERILQTNKKEKVMGAHFILPPGSSL